MRIELYRQERPGGRFHAGKPACWKRDPRMRKALCRKLGQPVKRIGRAVEDCNGKAMEDRLPAPPMADLRQIVGAHQPNEALARKASLQRRDRIRGKAGAEAALEIEHADARVVRECLGLSEALGKRRHAGDGLQGVLRRDQPPHLIEAEAL